MFSLGTHLLCLYLFHVFTNLIFILPFLCFYTRLLRYLFLSAVTAVVGKPFIHVFLVFSLSMYLFILGLEWYNLHSFVPLLLHPLAFVLNLVRRVTLDEKTCFSWCLWLRTSYVFIYFMFSCTFSVDVDEACWSGIFRWKFPTKMQRNKLGSGSVHFYSY